MKSFRRFAAGSMPAVMALLLALAVAPHGALLVHSHPGGYRGHVHLGGDEHPVHSHDHLHEHLYELAEDQSDRPDSHSRPHYVLAGLGHHHHHHDAVSDAQTHVAREAAHAAAHAAKSSSGSDSHGLFLRAALAAGEVHLHAQSPFHRAVAASKVSLAAAGCVRPLQPSEHAGPAFLSLDRVRARGPPLAVALL